MIKDFTDYYVYLMKQFTCNKRIEPNFIDVIAVCRGWLPLDEGEVMNITYGNRRYRIERLEDRE